MEVQVAIGVVFYDQRVVLHGQLQHFFAAFQAQQPTRGVAKGGDQVNKFGFVLGYQGFQRVGLHAVVIHRGAD